MPLTPGVSRVEIRPVPLKFYAGSIVLAVLSLFLLGSGGWLVREPESREPGCVFLVLGALMAIAPVVNLVRRGRSRATLEADTHGVTITRRGRPAERHAYDDVEFVTLDAKEKLSNGEPAGWTRKLAVRGPSGSFAVVALSGVDEPDEMGAFLDDMLDAWVDAVEARLERGREIRGRGWTLAHAGFRTTRMTAPVPVDAIASAGLFQGGVSLWRRGEDLPFFSVDAASENARTLLALVTRATADRPEEPIHANQLGRVLFEKGSRSVSAIIALWLGALSGVAGYMVKDILLPMAVILGSGGVVLIGIGLWSLTLRIRVHQAGIVSRSILGDRVLLYRDVARFSYNAIRHHHNGAYTGTQLTMKLAADGAGRPVRFSTVMRGSDQDLDALRDHIAQAVAPRLHSVVKGGGEVRWGKDARITRGEVRGRRSGFLGKRKVTVPIEPDLQERFHEGRLFLSVPGSDKPVLDVGCGEVNFYPGHLLLAWLVEEAEARAETSR